MGAIKAGCLNPTIPSAILNGASLITTDIQRDKRLNSIWTGQQVFSQTPEYEQCPDFVQALEDKICPDHMPDIDFMMEKCTSSRMFNGISIDKDNLSQFCKDVEYRCDMSQYNLRTFSNKELFDAIVDSSNWFGYISSLKYWDINSRDLNSNIPWMTPEICGNIFNELPDGRLSTKTKVIEKIIDLDIEMNKRAELLTFISKYKSETGAFSHSIISIVDHGFFRFVKMENRKEQAAFNLYTFLLMFNMKLCAFNSLIGYQSNVLIDHVINPQYRSQSSRHFDLVGEYLNKMSGSKSYSKFIMERWLHLLSNAHDYYESVDSLDCFREFMGIQLPSFNDKYSKEIASNRYFKAIRNYYSDCIAEHSVKKSIVDLYRDNFFDGDSLVESVKKNDPDFLSSHNSIRVSEYNVGPMEWTELFQRTFTVQLINWYGEPRKRPSTFMSNRVLDVTKQETDQFFMQAIKNQTPVFGYGIRYKTQPPFILFPIVQNGQVRKLFNIEMSNYWFAPDIRVEDYQ